MFRLLATAKQQQPSPPPAAIGQLGECTAKTGSVVTGRDLRLVILQRDGVQCGAVLVGGAQERVQTNAMAQGFRRISIGPL